MVYLPLKGVKKEKDSKYAQIVDRRYPDTTRTRTR
jgi:hypothetical protein